MKLTKEVYGALSFLLRYKLVPGGEKSAGHKLVGRNDDGVRLFFCGKG